MTPPHPDTHPHAHDQPDDQPDVRLVVSDMDGTLLDGDGNIPAALWPLLEEMTARGVTFVPASGRQYATLEAMFARAPAGTVIIAENGAYVVRDGVEVSSAPLPSPLVRDVVRAMREAASTTDLGVVVCARTTAYVERTDRAFLDHVDPYYAALTQVDDLLAVDDEAVKVAVFSFTDPEQSTAPALGRFADDAQVVVSGAHWVDVMPRAVHKGVAVRRLQAELGVTAAQTVVFGDYLNDLEMLDAAELSYAMADAHPDVVARAHHLAPSHRDEGVITVLADLVARMPGERA